MLTKNLLRFRKQKGVIKPSYIDPHDSVVLSESSRICAIYRDSIGKPYGEMKLEVKSLPQTTLTPAFEKLLDDRLSLVEIAGSVEEKRWAAFSVAEECRKLPGATLEEFQSRIASTKKEEFQQIEQSLYADLPQQRLIGAFKEISDDLLPHRYNCALLQGLILRGQILNFEVDNLSLGERRKIFQLLKFYRLLPKITLNSSESLQFSLSGPLSLFDSVSSYGMKLANFFPHVLHFKKWRLRADIRFDGKDFRIEASDKLGIRSHYNDRGAGYIPAEFQQVVEKVAKDNSHNWTARLGVDFLNLGDNHICFPDFTLVHPEKGEHHFELFHKWHRGEVLRRIEKLDINESLIIGICSSLRKKLSESMDGLCASQNLKVFWFRDFPTSKAILAQLP